MVGDDDEIKDRISILSNDLLGLILSSLSMKEAAATSKLSRRWRYLWTLSPTLDLDGTEIILLEKQAALKKCLGKRRRECVTWVESLEKKRREYVSWVDRVLGCCSTAERLVEFRLLFDLTNNHATHIDRWLHFAVSRKVESLELNLPDQVRRIFRRHDECYNFPYGKWNFPDGLKMMKKLITHKVNVSGEALEFFLGNCPLLEQLTVSASAHLTALQIIQTFPSFKCLEISFCDHLDSLVIRDSDLVTLKYSGKRILDFQLLNVPLLTQLSFRSSLLLLSMKDAVEMFSPLLPQLHKLKIHFFCSPSWDETETFLSGSAARLSNLKQLEVTISLVRRDPTLLPLINLISAPPCLQRFVVEVRHMDAKDDNLFRTRQFDRRVYPHLKEVEFVGYRSRDKFHELIMHLVENDVALETIVVDPRCFQSRLGRPWDGIVKSRVEEEMLARAYAKEHLTNTIGVSKESQLRAAKILQVLSDSHEQRGSFKEGEAFFDHSYHLMGKRWKQLRDAVKKSKLFSLPEFHHGKCSFSGRTFASQPAFAWLKCEGETEDCESFLRDYKILTRSGKHFGESSK